MLANELKVRLIESRLKHRLPQRFLPLVDTEQIAIDAYVRACARLGCVDALGVENEALVHKIARDLFFNALRDISRRKRCSDSNGTIRIPFEDVPDRNGESSITNIDLIDSLERISSMLDDREKVVFELRQQLFSDNEIAEQLGLSASELKSIRRRIKQVATQLGFEHKNIRTQAHRNSGTQIDRGRLEPIRVDCDVFSSSS